MSTIIEIPGGTATLRDIDDLTVGQERFINRAMLTTSHIYARLPREVLTELGQKGMDSPEVEQELRWRVATLNLSDEDADALQGQQDYAIVGFLDSWSLDEPLPTLETIPQMKRNLYQALAVATAPRAASLMSGVLDTQITPGQTDSPFGGSATSSSVSSIPRAKRRSIPKSQRTGKNTAIARYSA